MTKWPLDFDELEIGQSISATLIENMCGFVPGTEGYRLKGQMALIESIRKARPDLDPYVRTHRHEILIMTPIDAAEHRRRQCTSALRSLVSNHRRNMCVDSSGFDEHKMAEHEHALYRNGRLLGAIAKEKRAMVLEAHKSTKPALE